jgi:hypothetical protein
VRGRARVASGELFDGQLGWRRCADRAGCPEAARRPCRPRAGGPSARGLQWSRVAGRARYRGARRRRRADRRAAWSASARRVRAALAAARRPCPPRAGAHRLGGCRGRGSRAAPLSAGNASSPSVRQCDVPRICGDASGSGAGGSAGARAGASSPWVGAPGRGLGRGRGGAGSLGAARREIGAEPRTRSSRPHKLKLSGDSP